MYGRWVRPYQWQPIWRHTRVADGHTVLNHAPVRVGGSLLWLAVLGAGPSARHAWLGVGEWRVGGLYAPANAQFRSANLTLPTRPLVLNADVAWPGISDPASQCDTLQELCQGYVMVELVDPATGDVEPGYEANDCVIKRSLFRSSGPVIPTPGGSLSLSELTKRDAQPSLTKRRSSFLRGGRWSGA